MYNLVGHRFHPRTSWKSQNYYQLENSNLVENKYRLLIAKTTFRSSNVRLCFVLTDVCKFSQASPYITYNHFLPITNSAALYKFDKGWHNNHKFDKEAIEEHKNSTRHMDKVSIMEN